MAVFSAVTMCSSFELSCLYVFQLAIKTEMRKSVFIVQEYFLLLHI